MACYVKLAKDILGDTVWKELEERHPDLLDDAIEGRSIAWHEIAGAEHPKFGNGDPTEIVQWARKQLLAKVQTQRTSRVDALRSLTSHDSHDGQSSSSSDEA